MHSSENVFSLHEQYSHTPNSVIIWYKEAMSDHYFMWLCIIVVQSLMIRSKNRFLKIKYIFTLWCNRTSNLTPEPDAEVMNVTILKEHLPFLIITMYLVCLLNTQGAWTFRKSTLAPLYYRVSLLDKDLKAKRLKTLIFTKNLSPLKNRVMNFQIYQVCEPIFCRYYQQKSLKVSLLVLSENLEMFMSMDKNEGIGDNNRWSVIELGHLSDAKDLCIHVPWTTIKASFQYWTNWEEKTINIMYLIKVLKYLYDLKFKKFLNFENWLRYYVHAYLLCSIDLNSYMQKVFHWPPGKCKILISWLDTTSFLVNGVIPLLSPE